KRIIFLADRERDGSLCCGAVRLSFACEFLYAYYQTHETQHLDALYEQLVNTIEQTIKAKE
ncbi:MAG: hypothetical protein K2Q33_05340, partial [Gammaproteobacteria bacterium]|nr:hypothetical protein [Gammaproteobacteria bacterium]